MHVLCFYVVIVILYVLLCCHVRRNKDTHNFELHVQKDFMQIINCIEHVIHVSGIQQNVCSLTGSSHNNAYQKHNGPA